MRKLIIITLSIAFSLNINAQEKHPKHLDTSLNFETRVHDLIQQMTLEEKISQVGNSASGIERLGVKPYNWWNECLHGVARAGYATVFPQAIGMAASFDLDMMSEVANVISDEARAKYHEAQRNKNYDIYYGLTFWSPNINIFRDPRWGRGHETYGEDPYLTGQMGIRFVKGLQGNDSKYLKLVATAKHYAVHNGPESQRHFFNAVPDTRDLWETYLPAFEDLMVQGKAYSIMSAYNRVDGESASGSWMLLRDILRNQWGFEGYVVSDCGAIRDIYAFHKIANSAEEAAAIGIRRGCDLNCGGVYQSALMNAVKLGLIDEGEINLAVYRLMLARMKLGMFDPDSIVPYAQIPIDSNDSPEHDAIAKEMALKSMTLLQNDGVLPLNKKKIKKIAVIGPNANSVDALVANYNGKPSHPVTVLQGIQNKIGKKTKVYHNEGCPIMDYDNSNIEYIDIKSKFLTTIDEKRNTVHGLTGEYFNSQTLSGEPIMTRIDKKVKMMWGENSPTSTALAQGIITEDKAINNDRFSIRWTGKLTPEESGNYEIGAVSDDGIRMWLNDEKIIDDWTGHGFSPTMTKVKLEAGVSYDIKLEYFDETGDAGIIFSWKKAESEIKKYEPFEPSEEMLAEVRKADYAIFVGGLDASWEGEEMRERNGIEGFAGGDRTKIELPEVQLKTIKALQATGTPVIFVLMAGSAIAFEGLEENIPAILMSWYPGQRGGDAVADVLFGDYNPAGRLPVTFYKSTNDLADFTDYNMQAGNGFTYRYFEGEPLYAFGHGLSYTSFEYSNLHIDKTAVCDSDTITVSVKIKNTGKLTGEEVVQFYTKDIESDIRMPEKQLRNFKRIALDAGETKTIEVKMVPSTDMRYYNPFYERYMVDSGNFEIQVGASSADIRLKQMISVE